MDKNAIKKYAVWARTELIERVIKKADEYEISCNSDPNADSIRGNVLTAEQCSQRAKLILEVKEKGFDQVMEEIAYTWFNRFCALRFMEVNGYLPTRIRVFTDDEGNFKPQILTEAINMELSGLDKEKVYTLKESNNNEELFKYLIITQCNALSDVLPGMFQTISDYTELLFPDNLLREGSVIDRMISDIPEEDWQDQVQIIGWLYQYYNTEPKDKVFADLKKNVKITKEKISAATQLFTPDWIVRYMVENSLGRLWKDGHNDFDTSEWKYYLKEADQEESVKQELDKIREKYKNISPEEITFFDPCMGSGHILVYAFDVFMNIYLSQGYMARDAVNLILTKNLYGADIDKRVYQLSYFSLMMKARQYDRRFLTRNVTVPINLVHFQGLEVPDTAKIDGAIAELAESFKDCDTYGSLINIHEIEGLEEEFLNFSGVFDLDYEKACRMAKIYMMFSEKYDIVCTNPPYMGGSNMNSTLSEFVKKYYPDYGNTDLIYTNRKKYGII